MSVFEPEFSSVASVVSFFNRKSSRIRSSCGNSDFSFPSRFDNGTEGNVSSIIVTFTTIFLSPTAGKASNPSLQPLSFLLKGRIPEFEWYKNKKPNPMGPVLV